MVVVNRQFCLVIKTNYDIYNNKSMSKKTRKENKVEGVLSKPVSMPFRESVFMNINRTGLILSNLTIAAFCFAFLLGMGSLLFAMVYPIIVIFNYLVAIGISILSLGLIYVQEGFAFGDLILFKFDAVDMASFFEFIGKAFPIALWVVFGISLASFVLLLIDKRNRKIGRIVFAGIAMVLSLALALLLHFGGIVIV